MNYRLVPEFQAGGGRLHDRARVQQSAAVGDDLLLGSVRIRFHLPRLFSPDPSPPELPGMGAFRLRPTHLWDVPDWDLIFRVFSDAAYVQSSHPEPSEHGETLVSAGGGVELSILRQPHVARRRRAHARQLVGTRRPGGQDARSTWRDGSLLGWSTRCLHSGTIRARSARAWIASRRSRPDSRAQRPAASRWSRAVRPFARDGSLTRITTSTPQDDRQLLELRHRARRDRADRPAERRVADSLNNVLSTDPTLINGVLSSNGQVWMRIPSACSSATRRSSTWAGSSRARGRSTRPTFLAAERRCTGAAALRAASRSAAGAQIRAADSVLLVGAAVANYGTSARADGMIALVAGKSAGSTSPRPRRAGPRRRSPGRRRTRRRDSRSRPVRSNESTPLISVGSVEKHVVQDPRRGARLVDPHGLAAPMSKLE